MSLLSEDSGMVQSAPSAHRGGQVGEDLLPTDACAEDAGTGKFSQIRPPRTRDVEVRLSHLKGVILWIALPHLRARVHVQLQSGVEHARGQVPGLRALVPTSGSLWIFGSPDPKSVVGGLVVDP